MQTDNLHDQLNLRVGVTIYPSQDKAIDLALAALQERCPAQFILLADTSGQLVSTQGERGALDLVALSSLIAGDLAASQEIARLTGQYQNCQLVLREGRQSNSFIVEVGRYLVLFVRVSTDVPLGWARLLIQETSAQIAEIMAATPDLADEMSREAGIEDISKAGFSDAVGDALDSLWTG